MENVVVKLALVSRRAEASDCVGRCRVVVFLEELQWPEALATSRQMRLVETSAP